MDTTEPSTMAPMPTQALGPGWQPGEARRRHGYVATATWAVWLTLLVGWLGDVIKGETLFCAWTGQADAVCRQAGWHWWALGGLLIGLALLLVVGVGTFSRWGSIDRFDEVPVERACVVLILLSVPNRAPVVPPPWPRGQWPWVGAPLPQSSAAGVTGGMPPGPPWNWEPLLKAVEAHVGTARRIILMPSRESAEHADAARRLIEHCLESDRLEVRVARRAPDFACLNDVRDAIGKELGSLPVRLRLQAPVVDVTGGLKTASIAAAVAAMDHQATLQYLERLELRHFRIVARRWHGF